MMSDVVTKKAYVLQHNTRLSLKMHFHAVLSLVHALYIVRLSSTLESCKTRTRNPGLRASKPETRVWKKSSGFGIPSAVLFAVAELLVPYGCIVPSLDTIYRAITNY